MKHVIHVRMVPTRDVHNVFRDSDRDVFDIRNNDVDNGRRTTKNGQKSLLMVYIKLPALNEFFFQSLLKQTFFLVLYSPYFNTVNENYCLSSNPG